MDEERIGLLSSIAINDQEINSPSLSLREKNGLDFTSDGHRSIALEEEVSELKKILKKEAELKMVAEKEVNRLIVQVTQLKSMQESGNLEIKRLQKLLENETQQKEKLEREITTLQTQLLQKSLTTDKPPVAKPTLTPYTGLPPEVGLPKIVSMLESDDADLRIQAAKVVANLATEDANQQQIAEAGGITSLLMLLRNREDDTTRRVTAGAIANLAMNGANQELIVDQGGIGVLSSTAANVQDLQTLRMIGGAIANLCGNGKFLTKLRSEGGIAALLGMAKCGYPDVIAQVVRGFSNFAKCELRASTIQGTGRGKSLLIEEGTLSWMVQNAKIESSATRRHIELALCHLAQQGNAEEMVKEGAIRELVRISKESSREDIRSLAHRTLTSTPAFLTELNPT